VQETAMDDDKHKRKLSSVEAKRLEYGIPSLGNRLILLCRTTAGRQALEDVGIDERVVEHLSACPRGGKLELSGTEERVIDFQAATLRPVKLEAGR
jgi:hypothetical protein